jgi:hypothetical protein
MGANIDPDSKSVWKNFSSCRDKGRPGSTAHIQDLFPWMNISMLDQSGTKIIPIITTVKVTYPN